MEFEISRFNINDIKDDKVVVLIGKRETGKSFLTKDILYHHTSIPVGQVISGTEAANEFFLQEEEEFKVMGAIMVIEWAERLSLPLLDAWRGKIEYLPNKEGRYFQLIPPSEKDTNFSTSSR